MLGFFLYHFPAAMVPLYYLYPLLCCLHLFMKITVNYKMTQWICFCSIDVRTGLINQN